MWFESFMLLLIIQAMMALSDKCPAGMKKRYPKPDGHDTCEPCPDGSFQSVENDSSFCLETCIICLSEKGSMLQKNCSKTANAECRCRDGFTSLRKDNIICTCKKGSGLKQTASGLQCQPCENGYFTSKNDSYCQKWKTCETSGIKVQGTRESDVICNNITEAVYKTPVTPETTTSFPVFTTRANNNTAFTTSIRTSNSAPTTLQAPENNDSSVLSFYVISLLLLVPLSAVSCKLLIIPCLKKQWMKWGRADIPCRSPVEECGDTNRSSLVKSCQGLP